MNKDRITAILAALITIGFFGELTYMLTCGVPEQGRDALLVMLGALGAAFAAVVNYYFGSSSGSAKKDDIIHEMKRQTEGS